MKFTVADPGAEGAMPPHVKISHKKMTDKNGHIAFMFLVPPHQATGSDTGLNTNIIKVKDEIKMQNVLFVKKMNSLLLFTFD